MKLLNRALKAFSKTAGKSRIKTVDRKRIINKVRQRHLTYLSDNKLTQIIQSLEELRESNVEGCIIEAGCALGGSLIVISAYSQNRPIHEYDTFSMIPAPTEKDPIEVHQRYTTITNGESKGIGGQLYYGYREDLLPHVRNQIIDLLGMAALEKISFHKGLLQETMRIREPVAFAHVDVDWYEPVKFSLHAIWPNLSPRGMIVLDDYFDWGGCRKAVDEFLDVNTNCIVDARFGNLKITKI